MIQTEGPMTLFFINFCYRPLPSNHKHYYNSSITNEQTLTTMALSADAKYELAETLKNEFLQYVNEVYDLELSELLANASTDFLEAAFEGQIAPELEAEVASLLIADAFIQL